MNDLPNITDADLRIRLENLAHQLTDDQRRLDALEADLRRLLPLVDKALNPPSLQPSPDNPAELTARPYFRDAAGLLHRLPENITLPLADADQHVYYQRLNGWPELRVWWRNPTGPSMGLAQ